MHIIHCGDERDSRGPNNTPMIQIMTSRYPPGCPTLNQPTVDEVGDLLDESVTSNCDSLSIFGRKLNFHVCLVGQQLDFSHDPVTHRGRAIGGRNSYAGQLTYLSDRPQCPCVFGCLPRGRGIASKNRQSFHFIFPGHPQNWKWNCEANCAARILWCVVFANGAPEEGATLRNLLTTMLT